MAGVKRLVIAVICVAIYVLLSSLIIGFKMQQVYFGGLVALLYVISKPTRVYMLSMGAFVVFWILFDYMKAIPNYEVSPVRIQEMYDLDKKLFGVNVHGVRLTLNEFWELHTHKILDFITGLFYLCWMPVPLIFCSCLIYTNRKAAIDYAIAFLFVNIIGWIIYYSFPAAPPWYFKIYGNVFNAHTPSHIAGLKRFDDLIGVPIFNGLYAQGSNVFAAMPSLHSAYPIVSFFFALKYKVNKVGTIVLGTVMVGIWFSAIYTGHHYVLDVLAGILCAVVGLFIYEKGLSSTKWYQHFLNKYYDLVKS